MKPTEGLQLQTISVYYHIYTNLPESQARSHILQTYSSDHKANMRIN